MSELSLARIVFPVRDGRRLRLRPAVSQAAQDPAAKESKAPSPTTP